MAPLRLLAALLLTAVCTHGDHAFSNSSVAVIPVHEEDHHVHDVENHLLHLERLTSFRCRVPQPRTIPVTQLLKPSQSLGKAYFPDFTVLHRCDYTTGCCVHGGVCGPLHKEPVQLIFKVTFFDDFKHHRKGVWEREFQYFYNHTECGCSSWDAPREQPSARDQYADKWMQGKRQDLIDEVFT